MPLPVKFCLRRERNHCGTIREMLAVIHAVIHANLDTVGDRSWLGRIISPRFTASRFATRRGRQILGRKFNRIIRSAVNNKREGNTKLRTDCQVASPMTMWSALCPLHPSHWGCHLSLLVFARKPKFGPPNSNFCFICDRPLCFLLLMARPGLIVL